MIARIVEIEGTSILIDVTISISSAVKDVICNDVDIYSINMKIYIKI